ncbi:MAG TPA: CHAT domain-containing protein, partial [Candidatus Nanopelagicales bacterium]|nr:CHAT domain-containing protein [Candidatus Nanopelagicales bacterium]
RAEPRSTRPTRDPYAHYAAYVLRRRGPIGFTDLGDAEAIDAAVHTLRRALADPLSDPRPSSRALHARVMAPLRPLLGDARALLLSPDGELSLVPFGALLDEAGQYLIERHEFTYLTTGRDLVPLIRRVPSRQAPVIVAAPDFDHAGGPPLDSPLQPPAPTPLPRAPARRGSRSAEMASVRFPEIPAAWVESQEIARALPRARLLTGPAATERAVKALEGPAILHFATHGFFLPAETRPDIPLPTRDGGPQVPDPRRQVDIEHLLENRLLRSGLALAGANPRRGAHDEDGILTALEVSGLDLDGTRLVVLSGCDTGVGRTTQGEGVAGLRRAFEMAGAESLVMSLWPVDDEATRHLMAGYYQALAAGAGRSEALRRIALHMKHDPTTAHPYYWAGFIFSGDASPLDDPRVTPTEPRVPPGPRGCACALADDARTQGAGRWPSSIFLTALLALAARASFPHRRRAARRVHRDQIREACMHREGLLDERIVPVHLLLVAWLGVAGGRAPWSPRRADFAALPIAYERVEPRQTRRGQPLPILRAPRPRDREDPPDHAHSEQDGDRSTLHLPTSPAGARSSHPLTPFQATLTSGSRQRSRALQKLSRLINRLCVLAKKPVVIEACASPLQERRWSRAEAL